MHVYDIFKILKPLDNNKLSLMESSERNEILEHINNYYLCLRSELGFNKMDSFGLEVEYEYADNEKIIRERTKKGLNNWMFTSDRSLKEGGEFDSPILYDSPNTWKELELICKIISNYAIIGENTGGHIHIGVQVLGNEIKAWYNFLKLWSAYEHIIYRFAYGEYLTSRPNIIKYAYPCAYYFWNIYQLSSKYNYDLNRINDLLSELKTIGVNFNNVYYSNYNNLKWKNTIEFRCPNGTLNPIIWQNNVNLFMHILKYVRSNNYDEDTVMKRIIINKEKYNHMNIEDYNVIYLDDALEFSDLVFTKNIDKVYFLRQYLKNNEISNKSFVRAKSFTEKVSLIY